MQCESKAGICNVEVQHSQSRASWESFESNVKAKPLYGSETWPLPRGLKKKLHELSIKNLRNWWPRQICNEELWRQRGQQPVRREIRQRAWRWIGHMLRPDGYKAKRAIEWNLQGKCKRGNPSTPGGKQKWQSQRRDSSHGGKWNILSKRGQVEYNSTRKEEDWVSESVCPSISN